MTMQQGLFVLGAVLTIASQAALWIYDDTRIVYKWRCWICALGQAYSMWAMRYAIGGLHQRWQFRYRYYIATDVVCGLAFVLCLYISIREEISAAVNGNLRFHYGGQLETEIKEWDDADLMAENPPSVGPERKRLEEARVAAEARISLEKDFFKAYTSYYPFGVIRIGIDKARNIETPFTVEGKLKGIACSREMCNARKAVIAADALETAIGFDDSGVAIQMLHYEDWMRELDEEEQQIRGLVRQGKQA